MKHLNSTTIISAYAKRPSTLREDHKEDGKDTESNKDTVVTLVQNGFISLQIWQLKVLL